MVQVHASRDADAVASRLQVGELVAVHGPAPQGGKVQGPAPPGGVVQLALQGAVVQGLAPPGVVVRLVE